MMRRVGFFMLIFIAFSLVACGTETSQLPPTTKEVVDGEFIYKLFSEKDIYKLNDSTFKVTAELTYVGDEDSITIFHAASPFYFPIEEKTRNIMIDYPMDQPLLSTELIKNQPLQETYTFSGGYSDLDDEEYVRFVSTIMNNGFPKGQYVVLGRTEFFIKDNSNETKDYKLEAEIGFAIE